MILLQFTVGFLFYGSHWNNITKTKALSIAGEVHRIMDTFESSPERLPQIITEAKIYDSLVVDFEAGVFLREESKTDSLYLDFLNIRDRTLIDNLTIALNKRIKRPFSIMFSPEKDSLVLNIQLAEGVFSCIVPPQRLLGSAGYAFLVWMIGASLLLFALAALFLLYQIRPIGELARAVDLFGRGVEHISLPTQGSLEIKQAAQAFDKMRKRILSQLRQRADMLLAVSHDLRTPLTRLRLEAAMMTKNEIDESKIAINNDIKDMEHMIESYLTFAKGEGEEESEMCDIQQLTREIISPWQRSGINIDLHNEKPLNAWIKPIAMKRCLNNIVSNAIKYAHRIRVNVGSRKDNIVITVDDDGPGIPEKERHLVFRPFYRTDNARTDSQGSGLGLSIALNIAMVHGGNIQINDSPLGGARILISLPI